MTPTSPTPRALLLAGLAFLLTACSADLSGTVHVTTKSGDARRGADVPVLLVREQFMGEWTEASATFKASYRQAAVAYVQARNRLQRPREDYVRSRTGYRGGEVRSYEDIGESLRVAVSQLEAVKREWSEYTANLARAAAVQTSRTDVNGRYEFRRVPRGKYYVMASHKLFGEELFWLVPVQVDGQHLVDLSSSNRSYPFDLIRGEADVASAVTAPASSPLPPEAPHQPKWLAEELAKEKQAVVDRREAKGGTWQLVQTVFRRRASAGEKFEDILKEIVANPDRFQSQAVVAESLPKDECRTVANRVSDGARTGRDRRYDYPNGVAFIRSDQEAADTSGWTKRPRIEEAITVQVWVCVNTAKAAASR
jgi:hypothetical protein